MRFVDAKNAFGMVNRDCLWYELMCIGIKGKFLNAVQSLYKNVSCTVKVNNLLNELVQCKLRSKTGLCNNLTNALFRLRKWFSDVIK